ncbi:MAG: amidohydrolase family protein [Candidatus Omnitrophota bacterium]
MPKITIPLLKDHHNHLSFYALLIDSPNLQQVTDKTDALNQLNGLDKSNVSVVLGWNSGYYDFTDDELNRLPPVIIVNISLHRFIMSASAEARLNETYPDVVANYKDSEWYENHFPGLLIFLACMVEPTEAKFNRFFNLMAQKGVYHVEDMLVPNEQVLTFMQESPYADRTACWTNPDIFNSLRPDARNYVKGIKLFTDGALGARTAALSKAYTNGVNGHLLLSDEELFAKMKEAADWHKAVAVHAIGEMATAQVVRTVQKLKSQGIDFSEIRMEHCQYIDPEIAHQAKRLGIILSMQPNFNTDSLVYNDRLHPWYLENNNPFRMLIDQVGFIPGKDLIFGSDGMPHGAEYALQASLFPPYPSQKLTLDEFVAGYCMPDTSRGSIAVEWDDQTLRSISVYS